MLLFLGAFTTTNAEDWFQWRGPHGNGVSDGKAELPVEWSKDKNVAWRLELPGPAGATPVIFGDKIFLTSVENNELLLMCISKQGKELWRKKVGSGNKNFRVDEGNMASPSPVTDGKIVVFFFGNGMLVTFDIDGKRLWSHDIQEEYGEFAFNWTFSTSPVLADGKLILQVLQRDTAVKGQGKPRGNESLTCRWKGKGPCDNQSDQFAADPSLLADAMKRNSRIGREIRQNSACRAHLRSSQQNQH